MANGWGSFSWKLCRQQRAKKRTSKGLRAPLLVARLMLMLRPCRGGGSWVWAERKGGVKGVVQLPD